MTALDHTLTVVLPIGPTDNHTRWLPQCLDSLSAQTVHPFVQVVDDAPHRGRSDTLRSLLSLRLDLPWNLHVNPWPLRDSGALNVGVGLTRTQFFFFLSCDDYLDPHCLEKCLDEYRKVKDPMGFYWPSLDYIHVADGNRAELVRLPTVHAMIAVELWKRAGGIPPQGGLGLGDTFFMNVLMTHFTDRLHPVDNYVGLYKHRQYEDQTNNKDRVYIYPIELAREIYLREWQPMTWVGKP